MKNFLIVALVAVATVLIANENALAGGGGGGGKGKAGGGSSKAGPTATLTIENTETAAADAISVWVRPAGTAEPATFGELQALLETIEPGESQPFPDLAAGEFDVSVIAASALAGFPAGTAIPAGTVDSMSIGGTSQFTIDGTDLTGTVDLTNGFTLTN